MPWNGEYRKMDKILISGNPYEAIAGVKEKVSDTACLKRVTVFFDNANFLITKYQPLTNAVFLILEMEDGTEVHIESANCGYVGGGPHATVSILEIFGLKDVERLVENYDALRFEVSDKKIVKGTINTSYLFFPAIRRDERDRAFLNKIRTGRNVDVDLENRKVMFYNPQRNCWNGFLNMLSYMENIIFEYYIGLRSPLEDGICMDADMKAYMSRLRGTDVDGLKHVNLVLSGSNFSASCFIDSRDEIAAIEAVYMSLTGKRLFKALDTEYSYIDYFRKIIDKMKKHQQEYYGKEKITK